MIGVAMLAAAGCSGSRLDDEESSGGTVKIGLIWPQTGIYKSGGTDLANAWDLYLAQHGGKLGGHKIKATVGDEGEGKTTTLASGKRLLDKENVDVIVGTQSADAVLQIAGLLKGKKIPFIGTGGRPSTLKEIDYLWWDSWLSTEAGAAMAPYMRKTVKGSVYVIGPNYRGGKDQIGGFTEAFTKAGGVIANDGKVAWTPFPGTTNFLPFFNQIAASDAKAIYTFYAGTAALNFVKQYKESGLAGKIPLYAAGFLTEGTLLAQEGDAADGVRTALNYASNLDNAQNRAFAPAYQKKYGSAPTIYSVVGWDAAALLDRAIEEAGDNPTGESINKAIAKVGAVDSPRGQWRFGKDHTPIQPYYLREVKNDGRARSNVVIENLETLGN
jgi:branched-chain amino acid transport system substrate-binding protein